MGKFGNGEPFDDGTALASAARLEALRQAGLSAVADESMERFARLVASVLEVPVALVSLVERYRQVFPGMVGLAEPWASRRQTPLSHSLCQHVTTTGQPLVLADVRLDERPGASLAVSDLGVIAYAGMPLTDGEGHVLGALCAIDQRPRNWSQQELTDLADLAAACNGELRLRGATWRAQQALADAKQASQAAGAARQAAEKSDAQAQAYAAEATAAWSRSQLMLRAAQDLADTEGLTEVRRKVRNLVSGDLKPSYVGLVLLEGQELRRVPDPDVDHLPEVRTPAFPADSPLPSARAVTERRLVIITSRDALAAEYGPEAIAEFDTAGFQSAVCVPLPGTRGLLGVLTLGWAVPHHVDVSEQAVLTAIAGYTATAIERAMRLDERVTVAHQLQRAMLTDLPAFPGLQLAAVYRPAAIGELVGGDWYDAYSLAPHPSKPGQDGAGSPQPLAITVGDIAGHDMRAATVMGQVRSMLRQADLLDGRGPAAAVTAVEEACKRLGVDAFGTLVHGHLQPAEAGAWRFGWVNAGHPPPLLSHGGGDRDGRAEQLVEHDTLLWPNGPDIRRGNRRRTLLPGDTLLLYTDGLVEHRHHDMDTAISHAAELLSAAPPGQPLPELVDQIIEAVAVSREDDIAVMALRVSGAIPA